MATSWGSPCCARCHACSRSRISSLRPISVTSHHPVQAFCSTSCLYHVLYAAVSPYGVAGDLGRRVHVVIPRRVPRPHPGAVRRLTADEDEARVQASYGANLDCLIETKKTYDPDNLSARTTTFVPDPHPARAVRCRLSSAVLP
ncbi:MAG: BBE domain-containing protein [Pseudonocardiaceae bacterium]